MDNELERCKPWIEAALEYSGGTHDFSDIVEGLRKGVLQLWPTPKGCIVTEIVVYPKKRVKLKVATHLQFLVDLAGRNH